MIFLLFMLACYASPADSQRCTDTCAESGGYEPRARLVPFPWRVVCKCAYPETAP